jgi:biotin carboxylase
VHATDRPAAVALLREALGQFEVTGVATNIPFLRAVAAHPDFAAGTFDTRWLETTFLPGYGQRKETAHGAHRVP